MVGQTLGHYRIKAKLGAGGMGEVYRASDPRLDRDVAIKVLPEHLAGDPQALARFEREAKVLAALSHPNILAVFDVGLEQGVHYLVTELLEGQTLRVRLDGGPLSWREGVEIAAAVADGLAAAVAKGITHRDLKPENIFLTSDGRVKILDFGLARYRPKPLTPEETVAATETQAGTVMGTVGYMSPEQVRGEPAEAPSDIFSCGCVLHEMVTGERAFARSSPMETLAAILRDPVPPATGVPVELQRVITHCLEKNPALRFQSARDLAFALRAVTAAAESQPVPVVPGGPRRLPAVWIAAAFAVLVAAAGVFWMTQQDSPIDSLAVLPLVNAGDPGAEYLSDGISESLITSLSRLPRLKVKSRDAVSRYKGQNKDAQAVGREQGVRAVLKGRLLQRGDVFTVNVELVDARDNTLLWQDQYERRMGDLLAVQQEISRQISAALRLKLTSDEQRNLVKRQTESTEAYQFYLKGRYWWDRRTEEALKKSVEFFDQAIEQDPSYARAWAGLADSYNMLGGYGVLPPRDAFPRAKAAAMKALELDQALPEAHASLGRVKTQYEWDWAGAERDYRRAVELNPNYGVAHQWYAIHLGAVGRFKEAIAEIERAREAEPLSLVINGSVGWFHYIDHQYERAIEESQRAIAKDPNFAWGHNVLGSVYIRMGRYNEAIDHLQRGLALSKRGIIEMTLVAHAFGVSGQREEAQKLIDELKGMSQRRFVPPEYIAMIYAGLGDKDQAFEWLEKAYAQRSMHPFFLPDPRYDPLRADVRFRDLMRRMGLPG